MRKTAKLIMIVAAAMILRPFAVSAHSVDFDDPESIEALLDGVKAAKPKPPKPPHNPHPSHPSQPSHPSNPSQPSHPSVPGGGHPSHPPQPSHPSHPSHPSNPVNPHNPWTPPVPPVPNPHPVHPPQPAHPWQPVQPWTPGHYDDHDVWHHAPWHHHPAPQHPSHPGAYQKTLRFESGYFTFASDARESMRDAVRDLRGAGVLVTEDRLEGGRYVLAFRAPSGARIERYSSGNYAFISDAREGLAQAVRELKGDGKIVLESRLDGSAFVVGYLEGIHYDADWNVRRFDFFSGAFTFTSDARGSMLEAVRQLRETGCLVFESRLNGSAYSLSFEGPARSSIRSTESRHFSFASDAREEMRRELRRLESRGNVILEARLNGTAYTISYLTSYR